MSPVKTDGPNGYGEPEENSAPEREVPKVQLSPTMRYSGLEVFAPKVQYVSHGSTSLSPRYVPFQFPHPPLGSVFSCQSSGYVTIILESNTFYLGGEPFKTLKDIYI